MGNKYLEKIAESNHILKGFVSPAWQERAIAADHGKHVNESAGETVAKHYGGHQRAGLRGLGEGLVGAVGGGLLGAGIGALAKNPAAGAAIGVGTGYVSGAGHGLYKSYQNQGKELNKKYSDKK